MRKNLKWLIITGVVVILTIANAVPVLAAGPNGNKNGSGNGSNQEMGTGITESVTGLLDLSLVQIQEQRQSGKSLVEIAAGQGISEEALIEAILKDRQVSLQKLVEAGTITQLQADQRLEQMKERVKLAVNRTTTGAPEWAGAGNNNLNGQGKGMKGPGDGRSNQSGCTGTTGTCTGAGKMNRSGRNSN